MRSILNRRAFLCGAVAFAFGGCGRKRSTGFPGYVFVANEEAQSIAAVDLTRFAVAKSLRLEGQPSGLIADGSRPALYALTPRNGLVHEIDSTEMTFRRKVHAVANAMSMRMAPEGGALWILARHPRQLVRLSLDEFRVEARISLPHEPADFDIDRDGRRAAVSFGGEGSIALVDVAARRIVSTVQIGTHAGAIRFRSDGRQVIAGNSERRVLTILDSASGRIVVHLPLAVRPEHFCFNADGGHLFVSGAGMDAVVVVYPYDTQVAETVLAGHAPGYMAASSAPHYLFVANPRSAEVTVMSIPTRKAIAVATVGSEPGYIAITPDNQYALVLNRGSGDMAVIRIAAITAKRTKSAPLFTMIPVGSRPVSAAVLAV